MQNEEPKLEKDDDNVQNVQNVMDTQDTKASEAVEAKATEVEMAVAPMGTEIAQVQLVQGVERQNAADTQSSADAEYMSRIERCHEEAMKKVVETGEAEESREKEESNVEDACGRGLG